MQPRDSDYMLWLRDFDCHHLLWEPEGNKHPHSSLLVVQPLPDLLAHYSIEPPGTSTLQTLADCWTHPDNIWKSASNLDPVVFCNIVALLHLMIADYLPIVFVVELPIPHTTAMPSKDFYSIDWEAFRDALRDQLSNLLATPLHQLTSSTR